MSPATAARPRKKRAAPVSVGKARPSDVILYGSQPRVGQVEKAMSGLNATLTITEDPPSPDAGTLGVVIVTPLSGSKTAERAVTLLREDRQGRTLPVFAVVDNHTRDRRVRQIYAAGATAVFDWPREALLLPRLVAELLGIVLVGGRATGPETALSRTVAAHLRLVPWSTAGVRATVRHSHVHLSGAVSAYWRKREIERLVARVPGVTRIVCTDLRVEPVARTDRQIAQSVRTTLRNSSGVDDATVSVAAHDATVKLAGTVADRRQLARILELVSNVAGVRDIEDALIVSSKTQQRDGAVARRLNKALSKWFPSQRATVSVFSGVAVISGKVRGMVGKLELEHFVAQDPAIRRVINKLDVG